MSSKRVQRDWEYPKQKTSVLLDTRVREYLCEEHKNTGNQVSRIINSICLEKMKMSGVVI